VIPSSSFEEAMDAFARGARIDVVENEDICQRFTVVLDDRINVR